MLYHNLSSKFFAYVQTDLRSGALDRSNPNLIMTGLCPDGAYVASLPCFVYDDCLDAAYMDTGLQECRHKRWVGNDTRVTGCSALVTSRSLLIKICKASKCSL